MIKISALNDETDEESASEEEVTKEALEQIGLQQYAKALELQRKGNLQDATRLLNDLLDTELLYDVKKPAPGEKISSPLFNLKYLCYKNLAGMSTMTGDVDAAIEAYCSASELDDTDITLWHKLGQLCMRAKRYEMALHAFQRGAERNPRHWPCLDKIVTLLLGLDCKEECISIIYETLKLDPGYLRGLAYRKHIFTVYSYIKDYMEYLNPIYKWDPKDDEPIDQEKAEILLKEAFEIHETFIAQQKAHEFKCVMPDLKLKRPIGNLDWSSVGESLIHMHHFMTDNCFSHACYVELVFEKEKKEVPMVVCEEPNDGQVSEYKGEENNIENDKNCDKNVEIVSENENNEMSDKEKPTTDTEKVESDVEMIITEALPENQIECKLPKKAPVRRRGSALSFLQQWEWCTKRRSGRKKPVNRQDFDDTIYDTLRRMVPVCLSLELVQKNHNQTREGSPDTADLDKLFEEKEIQTTENEQYFKTEQEQREVKDFIAKYTEHKRDIIDMLKDYLNILAGKWRLRWPDKLYKLFIEANKCYNNHIDIPSCTGGTEEDLIHYTTVNLLVEEFIVNEKLESSSEDKHDLSVVETIGIILNMKPHIFAKVDCLELMLRYLWCKFHIHMVNKAEDFALHCLYQLCYEFEAMGEYHDKYNLYVTNFTFKPMISESIIFQTIKFLERNKKLSTVMNSYKKGHFEEVLAIVIDSFEHYQNMARNQEEEMSLDFSVQLSLILDSYWALDDVEQCLKWSFICLHEALKHYFRCTSGSPDYEKWTLTVVKILYCMEHILSIEGLSYLKIVPKKELGEGLDDLIRIIGHQVETNASEMPLDTVVPWIIMHYILQREEDQGRSRPFDKDKEACDEVPNPLLILFIGHEQLGARSWCGKSNGKLLYFILDTVVPRLHSPALAKSLEQICQYMEQCVYCLYGHPAKKAKHKYLVDHNITPHILDWKRAQQLYEIFRPPILPALEGKVPGITADTEQLFHRILALLPAECDPSKYICDIEKYIKGVENRLPSIPVLLPYKMRDIYFLLGDYYFKRKEGKMAVKYNMLDVAVNSCRFESWAEISLAKALNLDSLLNSCKNLNNEREYLNPAKSIIRCFKHALDLDPTYWNIWIEYGMFVYTVHSFCSRLLKQASESLSMEDFESLEKQKEDMLDTTQKCFTTILSHLNNSNDTEKEYEESWLYFYMLGKVTEKRNKAPSVYLDYYMKAIKCLEETDATYPFKINYNSPTHLCIEVLELHYRIHASILKYIEQHENKPIQSSVGKIFITCIENWKNGPFIKKTKKDGVSEGDIEQTKSSESVYPANIFKRSISDAGEDDNYEMKKMKLESAAAKVRRSASYDTERLTPKEPAQKADEPIDNIKITQLTDDKKGTQVENPSAEDKSQSQKVEERVDCPEKVEQKRNVDTDTAKKDETSSASSSPVSLENSTSDSSYDSSSDSSKDSTKSGDSSKHLTEEQIMNIVSNCLDALEDCASRFPPHYKAIYRLAHYHFYYKKGKDIERCRDLMLLNFTSRSGQKLAGLFSERKSSNFFNNIWKIPVQEVERAGGFAFHMSRCVLLTMEILKEIDDHKTLLDLSLYLQRIPDADKKYLRDADREELAQQAFSLCVQSLKGQLTKFGQQADLKSNEVERQALNSLMVDIYKAYTRAQKQPNSKQFINLMIEGYKLATTEPLNENINLVDISMKYCQKLKQEATLASLDKNQNTQKKQLVKTADVIKPSTFNPPKVDPKPPTSSTASSLPKISAHEMVSAFQNYIPMLNDPVLSQQTAAALSLSYLSNMSALAGYASLQNTLQSSLQSSLQNSFQAEFYRQFLGQTLSPYMPHTKKIKRGPKPPSAKIGSTLKTSKSFTNPMTSVTKSTSAPIVSSLQKSASTPLTASMGKVLPSLPASMTANLSSFGSGLPHSSTKPSLSSKAHASQTSLNTAVHSKPPIAHQQTSSLKTLQEKLAERKHLPIPKTHDEVSASINKLPSSLTITKTTIPKPVKKPEAKKTLPISSERPKPITSGEVIVLDDDD